MTDFSSFLAASMEGVFTIVAQHNMVDAPELAGDFRSVRPIMSAVGIELNLSPCST
jgi:hypothetical protein